MKFTVAGNQGLDIFLAGSPTSGSYACTTGAEDLIEITAAATTSGLSYDAVTGQYQYVWKSEKAWANSCRKLALTLKDAPSARRSSTS